jgi:biopolymer transport protein ExbB
MMLRFLRGRTAGMSMLAIVLVMVTAFSAVTYFTASPVLAQFEENDGAAAAAPADAGGGAAAPADAGQSAGDAPPPSKSRLIWFYEALGLFYSVVFLGMSFILVALLVMSILTTRRDNVVPLQLVEAFEAQLNEKRYQEAYEMAKTDESVLGQVLSAGLAKLSQGYEKAIEAMQEVSEEENMKLQHRLSYIAMIGSIAPMVGLYGTVDGMIASFEVLATSGGGAPKPQELANGISTALVTTLIGLAIAIPAICAFGILKNRVQRLVLEVGILSEGLMSRFETVGRK